MNPSLQLATHEEIEQRALHEYEIFELQKIASKPICLIHEAFELPWMEDVRQNTRRPRSARAVREWLIHKDFQLYLE